MDWLAWLSKTGLDPAMVYEYGLEFTRNELQCEDLPYFDHEFLQSMGISVAKHRLEILKLARKDASRLSKRFSVLITAINKTKRSVGKYIGKLIPAEEVAVKGSHEPFEPARENRRVALTSKYSSDKEFKGEKVACKHRRSLALSGPLDGMFQQKYLAAAHKSSKLSGPLLYGSKSSLLSGTLDVKSHENAILALQNSESSRPLDRWALAKSPRLSARNRNMKSSGPLERATTNRSPRDSGPLDGTAPGQCLSPRGRHVNGNLDAGRMIDGLGEHSLWAKLFCDMKPT